MIVQTWTCPACDCTYESPIAVNSVTCFTRSCKKRGQMMDWKGQTPPEVVLREKKKAAAAEAKKKRARPRAVKVNSVNELTEQLRRSK